MEQNEPKQLLLDWSLGVTLNASDFFAYACADAVTVSSFDYEWVLPFIEKHGDTGVKAVMSHIRKALPIPPYRTDEFLAVLAELQELNPEVDSEG